MKKPDSILVADDEEKIVEVLRDYLVQAGYHVLTAYTGEHALRIAERDRPSLIILDLMLPDVPGEEVCARVRAMSSIPILMLTAKHAEGDRLNGLEIGADDYVTKPFSVKEVVARVGVILRRTQAEHALADRLEYRNGDLVVHVNTQTAYKRGILTQFTTSEFKLLSVLCRHPRRVFSREELIEFAFGLDFRGDSRSIDAHIKNLRAKIEDDARHPVYIQTVYGAGYRFGGVESETPE